jgi:hypothetical protein
MEGMRHMKKLAIGCGIVLVLCVIGVTVAGVFVYMKVRSAAQGLTQIAEIQKLDNKLVNHAAFTAPANGELTEDYVRRFVSVQEMMTERMGTRVKELDAKVEALKRQQHAEHRDASISEAIGMFNDLMGLILQAKTVWVDARRSTPRPACPSRRSTSTTCRTPSRTARRSAPASPTPTNTTCRPATRSW